MCLILERHEALRPQGRGGGLVCVCEDTLLEAMGRGTMGGMREDNGYNVNQLKSSEVNHEFCFLLWDSYNIFLNLGSDFYTDSHQNLILASILGIKFYRF